MSIPARAPGFLGLLLLVALAPLGCKSSEKAQPVPAAEATSDDSPSDTETAAPTNVSESCRRVCDRQAACVGAPEFAGQCAQICRDQAKLPEQQEALLAAHKRIIAECFPEPCSGFDTCFRRVVAEETERLAKEVGATANLELTPEAREAFKDLFCKIVKDSGGELPNLADPKASPDIEKWHEWMKILAQDPTTMQQLLKEAESECSSSL